MRRIYGLIIEEVAAVGRSELHVDENPGEKRESTAVARLNSLWKMNRTILRSERGDTSRSHLQGDSCRLKWRDYIHFLLDYPAPGTAIRGNYVPP